MFISHTEVVRHRVKDALGNDCPACGQYRKPLTARALARLAGVKPGVVRRFAEGGVIWTSHLDAIDRATSPDVP